MLSMLVNLGKIRGWYMKYMYNNKGEGRGGGEGYFELRLLNWDVKPRR